MGRIINTLVVCTALGLIATGLVYLLHATDGNNEDSQVFDDLMWTWWSSPIATSINGTVYFTGVSSDGVAKVLKKERGQEAETSIVDKVKVDDHNAPSIVMEEGKDPIVFYTEHNKDSVVNYRKQVRDSLGFGGKRLLRFPDKVSYTQAITNNDRIFLFTRVGLRQWSYMISEDWAETWSTPTLFLDACEYGDHAYILLTPVSGTNQKYHLAMYGHPSHSNWRGIEYGLFDIKRKEVSKKGMVYSEEDLPLKPGYLEGVWSPKEEADENVRLLDVAGSENDPVVFYAGWSGQHNPTYRFSTRVRRGEWKENEFALHTGATYGHEGANYVGGISMSKNGTRNVLVARNQNGQYILELFRMDSSYRNLHKIKTLERGSTPLIRPIFVHGHESALYLKNSKYESYMSYRSEAILIDLVNR